MVIIPRFLSFRNKSSGYTKLIEEDISGGMWLIECNIHFAFDTPNPNALMSIVEPFRKASEFFNDKIKIASNRCTTS